MEEEEEEAAAELGINRINRWGESFTCDEMSAYYGLDRYMSLLGNRCALCVHVNSVSLHIEEWEEWSTYQLYSFCDVYIYF